MTNTKHHPIFSAILSMSVVASVGLSGEANFTGTWKMNLQKSQLTGQTFNVEKTAAGMMHFDSPGFSYDFKPDGKEYPAPDGSTVRVQSSDPTTWDFIYTMAGKVMSKFHVSLHGDSQTIVMYVNKPDGTVVEQTSTATRMSGGPGLLGKWKSTEVKGGATTMVIATKGKNGVTVEYPEFQQVCKARFDGKDHTITQAAVASKMTLAFERSGSGAFKMTTKLQGKPVFVDTFTLSADGNTLTDDGNAVTANEPIKAIYERQ